LLHDINSMAALSMGHSELLQVIQLVTVAGGSWLA
jgi:hypothetical protein